MKKTVIGILAHVDAGKTTLTEAMLYCAGVTRTLGRVDHGDAFLDNFSLERKRGITIFSKQAILDLGQTRVTLLDTPGHADFSAEMERTLDVLDCAILVISGTDGVQSHTRTLVRLLQKRSIPIFVFVNKMDLPGAVREEVLASLNAQLDGEFFDFENPDCESVALCDEALLEEFLTSGTLEEASLGAAAAAGKAYPCWFGAALKLEGVEAFLSAIERYAPASADRGDFAARVFKISRDTQGNRLTHLKVTGGQLCVRDVIAGADWEEKATQLRIYSGAKYAQTECAQAGDVVEVLGLTKTRPGMGLGAEPDGEMPALEPVMTYTAIFPEGCDVHKAVGQLRQLEEEDPMLRLDWNEGRRRLNVQLMGPIQLEVLTNLAKERFDLDVRFDTGRILYRETIEAVVEGVGHYEPLRHYAEVHLLIEPLPRGSGLVFGSICPEDSLARNWQRLILTHLAEKAHLGVLTGSPITDIKITLASGRAHLKHTEGGDFRQATYRAVRQGLMQAKSILLEPWYDFAVELPQSSVGRALADLQRMGARCAPAESRGEMAFLSGSAPAAAIGGYAQELVAYTRGLGSISCSFCGFEECADAEAVIREMDYDPESDVENTPDSVFCSHGAGHVVKWNEVPQYMHLGSALAAKETETPGARAAGMLRSSGASDQELLAIFERTYGPVKRELYNAMRPAAREKSGHDATYRASPVPQGPEYLLVDGYNIIHAWERLRVLAEDSLETARNRLVEILRNYQGFCQNRVILVFDAYKVRGGTGSVEKHGGVTVVYTKEAETADTYIEKASYDLSKKHRVRVATSDGLEQLIILGVGALRVSASAFEAEVESVEDAIRTILKKQG